MAFLIPILDEVVGTIEHGALNNNDLRAFVLGNAGRVNQRLAAIRDFAEETQGIRPRLVNYFSAPPETGNAWLVASLVFRAVRDRLSWAGGQELQVQVDVAHCCMCHMRALVRCLVGSAAVSTMEMLWVLPVLNGVVRTIEHGALNDEALIELVLESAREARQRLAEFRDVVEENYGIRRQRLPMGYLPAPPETRDARAVASHVFRVVRDVLWWAHGQQPQVRVDVAHYCIYYVHMLVRRHAGSDATSEPLGAVDEDPATVTWDEVWSVGSSDLGTSSTASSLQSGDGGNEAFPPFEPFGMEPGEQVLSMHKHDRTGFCTGALLDAYISITKLYGDGAGAEDFGRALEVAVAAFPEEPDKENFLRLQGFMPLYGQKRFEEALEFLSQYRDGNGFPEVLVAYAQCAKVTVFRGMAFAAQGEPQRQRQLLDDAERELQAAQRVYDEYFLDSNVRREFFLERGMLAGARRLLLQDASGEEASLRFFEEAISCAMECSDVESIVNLTMNVSRLYTERARDPQAPGGFRFLELQKVRERIRRLGEYARERGLELSARTKARGIIETLRMYDKCPRLAAHENDRLQLREELRAVVADTPERLQAEAAAFLVDGAEG